MNKVCTVIIGSYFPKEYSQKILSLQKNGISLFSNSIYEEKLFFALSSNNEDVSFISAPPTGNYPFSCTKPSISAFPSANNTFFVGYSTIIGVGKISKTNAIKREIWHFVSAHPASEYRVIVSELHTPYLLAAKWFKKHVNNCKVLQIVPDLPQYSRKKTNSLIYKILKEFDVAKIYKTANQTADCFLFFAEPMKSFFIAKPYAVSPGIFLKAREQPEIKKRKSIVFTGKVSRENGIDILLNAFQEVIVPGVDLFICGYGEDAKLVLDAANKDKRIHFLGFIDHSKALSIERTASVLVSPRPQDTYTSFSFPSKVIEYLSFNVPVVTFHLDCYPKSLDDALIYPKDETPHQLAVCLNEVLKDTKSVEREMKSAALFLDSISPEKTKSTIERLFESVNK